MDIQLLLAVFMEIARLLFLILKLKVQAFLALLLFSCWNYRRYAGFSYFKQYPGGGGQHALFCSHRSRFRSIIWSHS